MLLNVLKHTVQSSDFSIDGLKTMSGCEWVNYNCIKADSSIVNKTKHIHILGKGVKVNTRNGCLNVKAYHSPAERYIYINTIWFGSNKKR